MKSTLSAGLIAFFLGIGTFTLSSVAEAYSNYYCKIVPAHWANGHKYPAQKVCWRAHSNCRYVAGHWRHGYWHEGHNVCSSRYN